MPQALGGSGLGWHCMVYTFILEMGVGVCFTVRPSLIYGWLEGYVRLAQVVSKACLQPGCYCIMEIIYPWLVVTPNEEGLDAVN